MGKQIDIVLPVFNEEEGIGCFHECLAGVVATLCDYSFRFIYVVDRGRDNTAGALRALAERDSRITVLELSRRFGHQMSLVAGMDHSDGDALIMMDSDLQHPPELIPELLRRFEEGYAIVHTRRRQSRGASAVGRWASRTFYRLLGLVSDYDLSGCADFRLVSRAVVSQFKRGIREQNQFLRGLFQWVGFAHTFVDYEARQREHGRSKYSLFKLLGFAATGLTSFSRLPLRLAMLCGLAVSAASLAYAIYVLIVFLTLDIAPAGWTSLAIVLSLLGGVQLVFLGVIGEYVGNIFDEVKRRPLYIVEHVHGGHRKDEAGE